MHSPTNRDSYLQLFLIVQICQSSFFTSYSRRKKEEGRRKKEEGRRKKEEGRRKKEEGEF
ncbi:MAG: hypothetical protein HC942_03495 [Microcoleus sp. SU_5_6]|nr:hypothetical protein [Microcoleus sp. SU_5_6]